MVHDEQAAALEQLAAAIPSKTYATTLTSGAGRQPSLCVVNRDLPGLAGDVYAEAGWFWWPWAERIATTSDPVAAAASVAGTLSTAAR